MFLLIMFLCVLKLCVLRFWFACSSHNKSMCSNISFVDLTMSSLCSAHFAFYVLKLENFLLEQVMPIHLLLNNKFIYSLSLTTFTLQKKLNSYDQDFVTHKDSYYKVLSRNCLLTPTRDLKMNPKLLQSVLN